jgi:hypothetical protein
MAGDSSSTRELAATAAPSPARGTSTASTSAWSNRLAKPDPSRSVSTTSTVRSPRRGSTSPSSSGHPSTATVASGGSSWTSSAAVRSACTSPAASQISERGSPEVSTLAANHTSGPEVGWRETMRRQAVTRPWGSDPKLARAEAVSCTITCWGTPDARAT